MIILGANLLFRWEAAEQPCDRKDPAATWDTVTRAQQEPKARKDAGDHLLLSLTVIQMED